MFHRSGNLVPRMERAPPGAGCCDRRGANTNTQVLDEAVSTIHRSFAAWLKATMSEAEPDPLRNHLRVVKRFCVYSTPLSASATPRHRLLGIRPWPLAQGAHPLKHHIEQWDQKYAKRGRGNHAAEHRGADGAAGQRGRAARNHQR